MASHIHSHNGENGNTTTTSTTTRRNSYLSKLLFKYEENVHTFFIRFILRRIK